MIYSIDSFLNVQLANIWPTEYDDVLNLMKYTKFVWSTGVEKLQKYTKGNDKSYVHYLIHDSCRSVGLLDYVIKEFEKEGKIPKDLTGWNSTLTMVRWIQHIEVYLISKKETLL